MSREDYLFMQYDLRLVMEHQFNELNREVDNFQENYILNSNEEDLAQYLIEKYSIENIVLDTDGITVDQNEISTRTEDYGREIIRKGTANTYFIPFTGWEELLKCQASAISTNPPRATVRMNEVLITINNFDGDAEKIKNAFKSELQKIQEYLKWVDNDLNSYPQRLEQAARDRITFRKNKILENKNLVADLGFPLRARADSTKTYSPPEIRKKNPIRPPVATNEPFKPEPALDNKDYEHILKVTDNMVSIMEKSPRAFVGMEEEDIRQHFLVQLNGHYEGSATGETFNFQGKTDILIKSGGRNIFIAECKFWRGPKSLLETIDQILSYASWRDTKTAIFIFNKNKNLSSVLEKIAPTVESHGQFKKYIAYERDAGWRAIFTHNDDDQRELILTLHIYEIPTIEYMTQAKRA